MNKSVYRAMHFFRIPEHFNAVHRGAVYMLISVVCFSLMNLTVKFLPDIPATELVLFRSIISLILSLIMLKNAKINPWGNNKKLLLVRGFFGVIALTLFFYTLQKMPLASAITIQYLSPIFTAVLAIFLLKERMRKLQFLFVFIAFSGVLLIKGFDPNVSLLLLFMGVGSAISSAFAYNAIRRLRFTDHPLVVVFYFPLIALPIMILFSFFYWKTPQGIEWFLLVLMGVLTQIAQVNMTKAYQSAPVSKVAPFKYVGVLMAIIFDMAIFGVSYQVITLLGIGLVITGVVLNMIHKESDPL